MRGKVFLLAFLLFISVSANIYQHYSSNASTHSVEYVDSIVYVPAVRDSIVHDVVQVTQVVKGKDSIVYISIREIVKDTVYVYKVVQDYNTTRYYADTTKVEGIGLIYTSNEVNRNRIVRSSISYDIKPRIPAKKYGLGLFYSPYNGITPIVSYSVSNGLDLSAQYYTKNNQVGIGVMYRF